MSRRPRRRHAESRARRWPWCAFLAATLASGGCAAPIRTTTVTPSLTDELLANPGMGWQTFHCFANSDIHLDGLPSSSAYFRLYWSEIEPVEGQIDFAKLDDLLARARRAGQKLALRIMCAGTDDAKIHVPQWLRDKGCPGFDYQYEGKGPRRWVPDMDQPLFQEAHFRLIAALGQRYDGHSDLDSIDIGSVGLWGEWHMSGTGLALPRLETRLAVLDAWCRAFPRTPKVMLIADEEVLRAAVQRGCGWRADCLGDLGGFSKTWNHMDHLYRQQVEKTDARDAWHTAPVAFESCWDMRKWKESGWDIDTIFDYALDLHASYINNKSVPLPPGSRPQVERLLRRLGYRLVLSRLRHATATRPGAALQLSMEWENTGVAPPYFDAVLAFRLAPRTGGEPWVSVSATTVRGWLPGPRTIDAVLQLPEDLPRGIYEIGVAVVDPDTRAPAVRLGITGRTADGWIPLSRVEVR